MKIQHRPDPSSKSLFYNHRGNGMQTSSHNDPSTSALNTLAYRMEAEFDRIENGRLQALERIAHFIRRRNADADRMSGRSRRLRPRPADLR